MTGLGAPRRWRPGPRALLATTDGQVAQRTATTAGQNTILSALELPEPPRFFDFTVPGA